MHPEWLKVATSPGLWIIGFIFAANGLIQSWLFYRLSRRVGTRLRLGEERMNEAVKSSFITSIGPAFGSFVGMTVLVLALGGAYAFGREAAGVGSIMYELIAARAGAEAAGVLLTREGMTVPALHVIFWVGALGSFGWVLVGGGRDVKVLAAVESPVGVRVGIKMRVGVRVSVGEAVGARVRVGVGVFNRTPVLVGGMLVWVGGTLVFVGAFSRPRADQMSTCGPSCGMEGVPVPPS